MQAVLVQNESPNPSDQVKIPKVHEILYQINTIWQEFCTNFPSNSSFEKKLPKSLLDWSTLHFPAHSCHCCHPKHQNGLPAEVDEQSKPWTNRATTAVYTGGESFPY